MRLFADSNASNQKSDDGNISWNQVYYLFFLPRVEKFKSSLYVCMFFNFFLFTSTNCESIVCDCESANKN